MNIPSRSRRRLVAGLACSFVVASSLAFGACSKEEGGGVPPPVAPSGAAPSYLLDKDPTGGLAVLEAKAAAPRKDVVVVGRVKELTPGFAAFTLTDLKLKYCGEAEAEGCPTPWDYCCTPNDEIAAATIGVIVPGPNELPVVLRKIGDFRNADVVVITGDLVKDADGEPQLHAKGWFRRDRPKLPDAVTFPE